MAKAECDRTAFYARIRRWREREKGQEASAASLSSSSVMSDLTADTPSSLSSASADASTVTITTSSTGRRSDRRLAYLKANMTSWTDLNKTNSAMSKRKKRPPSQVIQDAFIANADKYHYDIRYKAAFKAATLEVNRNREDPNKQGKRGCGVRAVVDRLNNEMLPSPNDKKLTRMAIFNAIDRGDIGVSPLKKGKKVTVTPLVTKAIATQAAMMQVCAEGEASAPIMKQLASALIAGTDHKFSADYAWRKTRMKHPEMLNPVKAKNHEDRRVDWLTYQNIIEWNARAKKLLIDIGMAKDTPGMIRKCNICCL